MTATVLIRLAALVYLVLPTAPLLIRLDPAVATDPVSPLWLAASFAVHGLVGWGLLRRRRLAYFGGLVLAVLSLVAGLAIWAASSLDPDLAGMAEYQATARIGLSMLVMTAAIFALLLHPTVRRSFTG